MDMPKVKPYDWIKIKNIDAVVCTVYGDLNNRIEVVFADKGNSNPKTNTSFDDAKWVDDHWERWSTYAGYAETQTRLNSFVAHLKKGRRNTINWE